MFYEDESYSVLVDLHVPQALVRSIVFLQLTNQKPLFLQAVYVKFDICYTSLHVCSVLIKAWL